MKKITLLIAAALLSFVAGAQKTTSGGYLINKFGDNWFITAGAGIQMPFNGSSSIKRFNKLYTPEFNFAVGKWITPSLALRLQAGGYYSKSAANVAGVQLNDRVESWNLHADAMFNLSNIISGYRDDRFFDVVPYVGFGMVNDMSIKNSYSTNLTVNAGIVGKMRVSNLIDINLEVKGMMTTDNLRSYGTVVQYGPLVAATAGITFKLGKKRNFTKYVPSAPVDLKPYKSRIKELEETVSESKIAEQKLSDQIIVLQSAAKKEDAKEVSQSVLVPDMTLFYSSGSSVLSEKELVNLKEIGKVIKQTPTLQYQIIGQIDYTTGSRSLNQKLCNERVEFVYYELISQFGVDPKQLVKVTNAPASPFSDATMNRSVVIRAIVKKK